MTRDDILRMAREATDHLPDADSIRLQGIVLLALDAGEQAEREAIMDEWSACVQSDLENGVRWLNEQAAKKWQESYPAMAGFADKIYARGETK